MKYIRYFVLLAIIVGVVYYRNDIANYILRKTNPVKKSLVITNNSYYSNNQLEYVHITDDFNVKNKQDILNVFYTILNSGMNSYEFTCANEYKNCLDDVETIIKDNTSLASINNMVHPYNSYENISVNISNYGKVEVSVTKVYNDEQINYVNDFVKDFIKNNVYNEMSDYDKIKIFHDYIINNTSFDLEESKNPSRDKSLSHTAYGLIINKKAICGGYSDVMSIYLYLLNIPNYRIATSDHVWNLVYVDNKWLHLDLTWDDPVSTDGENRLLYDYFLIDNNKLLENDKAQHNYNRNIYLEAY
ncbi:MAG: hypothetical protein IJR82_04500 [Bacilli bacterium]|nr:hypothetical protein [Bacilli bacterium]